MPITLGGINTGLPPNLVDQLIEAERIPIKNIEAKRGKTNEQLKLVEDMESRLAEVQKSIAELASTRGFTDIKLISGDPNIVQGVVDPALAVPGSWNIEVLELANKAAAITNGFPDKDRTEIGVGYFRFDTPEGKKEVYINGTNNTLEGAAQAINNARVGMRASVVNDRRDTDNPYRLVISGDNVGNDNQIKYPTLYFLDGDKDIFFDESRPASNGRVKIDGFEIEIPDNTIEDMIPGVTVEIKQAAPGRNINLTVKEDLEVVSGKIKTFVDAMNKVLSFIQEQSRIDKGTDTTRTLGGDSTVRNIHTRLRRLIQDQVMGVGDINRLAQLGIQFNRGGTLDFDQDKFNSTLAKNPEGVQKFFAGDGFSLGFIPSLKRTIGTLTSQPFGPLVIKKHGLQQKIDSMNNQIERKEKQLEKKEASLRNKFAQLETTMAKLKTQGAQLAAVGGGGGALAGINLGGAG